MSGSPAELAPAPIVNGRWQLRCRTRVIVGNALAVPAVIHTGVLCRFEKVATPCA